MSTPTIDYDALARQAGAVNVPPPVSTPQATAPPSASPKTTNAVVDYDALARQAGAVDVQPLKPATTPTQTSFRENVAQGVGTAAAQSLSGIAEVGSHIPGTQYVASKVGDVLGLPKLPANTNPYETVNKSTAANATAANQTTGGKVGAIGENLAEFVLGDEALKGLSCRITMTNGNGAGTSEDLIFGGGGVHTQIASASAGVVGFQSGVGVYAEGFLGEKGGGFGAYLNVTTNGGCPDHK